MNEAAKLTVELGILNASFGRESSVAINMHDASVEQIQELIKGVAVQASSGHARLKNILVGSDILTKLGGPSHFFDNARNDDGVIIAGTADVGMLVFSFAP